MIEQKYLTTKQAAEILGDGTTFRDVIALIHEGRIPAVRNPSKRGHFKIKREDLENIPPGDGGLSTREAARYIGGDVTFRTIVRWIHSGKLRATRVSPLRGHFRIQPEDLDKMLESPHADE